MTIAIQPQLWNADPHNTTRYKAMHYMQDHNFTSKG